MGFNQEIPSTPRRFTLHPPKPTHPIAYEICQDSGWDWDEDSVFEATSTSSSPTLWQAPPTECGALAVDDIPYRTIASALAL